MDVSSGNIPATSKMAWASLFAGVGGFALWPGLSFAAIILGAFAWWEIWRRQPHLGGRAQAFAAMALGLLNIALLLWLNHPATASVDIKLPR